MTTFVYDNCTAHWHWCIDVIQCRCGWSTVGWSSVSMCVVCCLWYSADVDDLLSGGERWHSRHSSQWSEASLCRDGRSQFVRRWSNDVRRLRCFWYSAERTWRVHSLSCTVTLLIANACRYADHHGCKWDYDAGTRPRSQKSRDQDETETLEWWYRDETEKFKKCLEAVLRLRLLPD